MIYETLVAPLNRLALSNTIGERAIAVQREMARPTHGNHLRPANDFLLLPRSPRRQSTAT